MFASCSRNSCMADEEIATARRVKDGNVQKYKAGFFGNKWADTYMVLLSDCRLLLFNNVTDAKATEYFYLPETIPFMCVGHLTKRLTAKQPNLPSDDCLQRLVAIALDQSGDRAYWLLFPTDDELSDWLQAMVDVLAQGPQHDQSFPPNGPCANQQYPNNTIVIHDRSNTPPSSGLAIGSGMLLGALAGYGIGSMFEPQIMMPADAGASVVQASAPEAQQNFFFDNQNAGSTETQSFVLDGLNEDDGEGFEF
ncbi:PH domain-containing protein [Aphelenchoides bicaudatus]|nr:PH domain-containing protein [Aphelenchoides bicaudatus]